MAITGTGTQSDPWVISTADDFITFTSSSQYWADGSYAELSSSIDMSSKTYTPISGYGGNFNGCGYIISNVSINGSGIFDRVSYRGTVKNLGVENCTFTSSSHVGSICGVTGTNVSISNCYSKNCTLNTYSTAGGILGVAGGSNSTVTNCYSVNITITNTYTTQYCDLGGIIGYGNSSNTLSNCATYGGTRGDRICGSTTNVPTITNCYSSSDISSSVFYSESFWHGGSYLNWDFTNTWLFDTSTNLPALRSYLYKNTTTNTKYTSLQTAYDEANTNEIITLLSDATESSTINANTNKIVTINLVTYTLYGNFNISSGSIYIVGDGRATSAKYCNNPSISSTYAVYISEGCEFRISNCTITTNIQIIRGNLGICRVSFCNINGCVTSNSLINITGARYCIYIDNCNIYNNTTTNNTMIYSNYGYGSITYTYIYNNTCWMVTDIAHLTSCNIYNNTCTLSTGRVVNCWNGGEIVNTNIFNNTITSNIAVCMPNSGGSTTTIRSSKITGGKTYLTSGKHIILNGELNIEDIVCDTYNNTCIALSDDISGYVGVTSATDGMIIGVTNNYNGVDCFKNSQYPTMVGNDVDGNIVFYRYTEISKYKNYDVVFYNGTNAFVCSNQSSNKFTNLQFEKRLNETGSGSVDLLVNDDTDILTSGTDIIIFCNMKPVYYGVITSVNNNNIVPFKSSLSKKYLSVEFSEGCRKLSYLMCPNNGTYSEPYSSTDDTDENLLYHIIGDTKYIGSVDNFSNDYTFSISNQDMLSQIDSLSEQCGARYKSNLKHYYRLNGCYIYNNSTYGIIVAKSGTSLQTIPIGTLIYAKSDSLFFIGVTSNNVMGNMVFVSQIYSNISITSQTINCDISFIMPNPIIDFKQSYYQDDSVLPDDSDIESTNKGALYVNKTTYDLDDVDSLNKHYGTISCTSPQMQGINITRIIDLNSIIGEDYVFNRYAYVTDCKDTTVIDCYINSGAYRLVIDGTYTYETGANLYYPYWNGNHYIYANLHSAAPAQSSWISSTYSKDGISYPCTIVQTTWSSSLPGQWSESSIIGMPLINNVITAEGNGISSSETAGTICIGGTIFNTSSVTVYGTTYTITLNLTTSSTWGTSYLLNIPNGTLILDDFTWTGSPKSLYPNRTLSVILQNNMDYGEVGLIASNLARYGSNFTQNVTGTCALKYFVKSDGSLPDVGDHVAIYYDDGSAEFEDPENPTPEEYMVYFHDYELQSYTVNLSTMTVDFNMGMKPLNIGDVIYRISQNMTTNITTN